MHAAFLNPQGNFDPSDSYWTEHPDFGGQLVYVKEAALAMAALGHRVDILTRRIIDPEWPEFEPPFDSYPGSEVRILRIPCGPSRFLPKEQLWPYLGTDWVAYILDFYQGEDDLPDIFTGHYADGGLTGAVLQKKTGIPFTFTAHSLGAQKMDKLGVSPENIDELDARFNFSYRIPAERISMSHSARMITSTRNERFEQYGHSAYTGAVDTGDDARFAVVPPGVNITVFNPEPTEQDALVERRLAESLQRDISTGRRDLPIVLLSSRLDQKKNHLGAVRAFAGSPELQARANLGIVVRGLDDPLRHFESLEGEGAEIFRRISQLMVESGLSGKVFGIALNSQAELAAAYRTAAKRRSVFCLTALYEPFGLAPLEAMSCGLPAVVTENGGPVESMRYDGREYGVLVDPLDPDQIADGLERALSASTWEQMRIAGIEHIRARYTWSRTAEGYLGVFRACLQEEPRTDEVPSCFTRADLKPETGQLARLYLKKERPHA